MNNGSTYERTVKVKNKGSYLAKKITVIMAYVLFFSVWLAAAMSNAKSFIPILTAGILSTLLVVSFTWKYLFLEYEYSFWYGNMSIAKIYAKRKRKNVLSTEIKDLLIIAPANEENIHKANRFEPEETLMAISSESADDIWLTVTGGKDEKRVLIFFEADERSLDMLKKANHFAFVKKI